MPLQSKKCANLLHGAETNILSILISNLPRKILKSKHKIIKIMSASWLHGSHYL